MQKIKVSGLLLSLAIGLVANVSHAQEITGTDILNMLVDQGILTEKAAEQLIEKVRRRNEAAAKAKEKQPATPAPDTQRVPYIPGYVKDQIKEDVVHEVRGQVLNDVLQHAKTERWGIPGAQPDWTNKIAFSGDARLRFQWNNYASDSPVAAKDPNNAIYNFNVSNAAGGRPLAGRSALVNVNKDNWLLRGRFRAMMKAKPAKGVEVGLRLVTGDQGNPVSSNQTLGTYGKKWEANFDLAYLKYTSPAKSLMLEGGRFINPFLHTDLVWDGDMTFEGLAGTWNYLRSDDDSQQGRQWDPFVTLGAFPLQVIHIAAMPTDTSRAPRNKWLYGAQVGTYYDASDQSRLSLGLSYYYYDNITGVRNAFDSNLQDSTAPPYLQEGNWVYNIRVTADVNPELFALASEYHLAGLTAKYDYAGFAPHHVVITGDVVKNLAFDRNRIAARTGDNNPNNIPKRDLGYQLGVEVGWPDLDSHGNWRVSFKYRHLEGDAVVDAFADSDFLLGGTNARGYILSGDYALLDNVYTSFHWISASEIDADPSVSVKVDKLFLDIGAKF